MNTPSIVEALHKKVEVEGPSDVGTFDLVEEFAAQTHVTTKKEVLPTPAVADVVNTCIHLNLILANNINPSNSALMT